MKAILTGSRGFIGFHLVARLKQEGIDVIPVYHEKLSSLPYLKSFLHEVNPDYIFHLSAYGNMGGQVEEDQILLSNVFHTYNLLQASKDIPYKLFINVSSSSVYGRQQERMSEHLRIKPDTLYAATKASGEYLCRYFRKKYKKTIVTVRPFSVYGPGEADFRFIPTLIRHALDGTQATVQGGNHDWIYIDDFVNGIMKIVENVDDLPHRTFNIGTGIMTSNLQIANMILKNFEYTDEIKVTDSKLWYASIRRLEQLNWKPAISLQEGIKRTYEAIKQQRS